MDDNIFTPSAIIKKKTSNWLDISSRSVFFKLLFYFILFCTGIGAILLRANFICVPFFPHNLPLSQLIQFMVIWRRFRLPSSPPEKQLGMVFTLQVSVNQVGQKLLQDSRRILHFPLQGRHDQGRHIPSVSHWKRPGNPFWVWSQGKATLFILRISYTRATQCASFIMLYKIFNKWFCLSCKLIHFQQSLSF